VQAAVLTTIACAVVAAVAVAPLLRMGRASREPDDWVASVPWDSSWPPLPRSSTVSVQVDEVRPYYAFAARHGDVLDYIPCYCGCTSEGHRSNHDCYVKERSADGRVLEWTPHGITCRIGLDITGDVSLWHEHGKPLRTIRRDIEDEYASRGTATPTPQVPHP
jgi:hypothetical protein